MRKIHLKVESLVVESYSTDESGARQGTVHAHETLLIDTCPPSADNQHTCARQRSDYASCHVNCECTNRFVHCMIDPTD